MASKKKASSKKKAASKRAPKKKGSRSLPDPSDTPVSETRFIQPYQATKAYLCPGCNGEIPVGMGHLVAVPPDDPDLRRHWHRGCWNNRANRR